MRLVLKRNPPTTKGVIGTLTVDGKFECYTLEDPDGAGDRIAAGTYQVILDFSNRFQKIMPHIIGSAAIDDRGIRIHAGNTEADTKGCVLVGQEHTEDAVQLSRPAFDALFAKVQASVDRKEPISIEIVDAAQTPSTIQSPPKTSSAGLSPLATRPGILVSLVGAVQALLRFFHS